MESSPTNYLSSVLHFLKFYRTLFDTISEGHPIDTSTLCKLCPLSMSMPLPGPILPIPLSTLPSLPNSTPHYLTRHPLSNLALYLAYSPLPTLDNNDHKHSRGGRSHLGSIRK
jgi:hypothetical protein